MKYTQYSQKKKGNSAFYITIALCLFLIGVAAWFALSRLDNNDIMEAESQNGKPPIASSEYNSTDPSYTESIEQETPANPTDEEVKNEEYTSKPQPVKKPKAYCMPVNGEILKDFSLDTLQHSATFGDMRIHAGVDIACSEGTLVSAVTDGKIQDINETADYGKTVIIDHGDGLVIKYCGLKNITAEKDTAVKMGDTIGSVTTVPAECSDQQHLHIEAYENGKSVSLLKFFE